MKSRITALLAFAVLVLVSSAAWAVTYPEPEGFITDKAGAVDAGAKQSMETLLTRLEKATGAQIAVAVIPSLEGEPIENYAVKLFEKWGVGQKDQDNGVLLVVATKDRKMRIETGYGLEGAIPDIRAKQITSEIIGPKFKAGDMSGGIVAGVDALAGDICKEYQISLADVKAGKEVKAEKRVDTEDSGSVMSLVVLALVFLGAGGLVVWASKKKRSIARGTGVDAGTSFWASSSSDGPSISDIGGFDGFDGGSSGGGGASDDW